MFCQNCGKEIRDDAKFCPYCGKVNGPDPGSGLSQGAAAAPAWEKPEGGGKKKKTGLIAGAAVAVVALVAVGVAVISGLFASPKDQVEKALLKSAAAWQAAGDKLERPDTRQWQRDGSIHQELSLELRDANGDPVGYDLSALEGLGLRMDTDYDGEARRLSAQLGAYWGQDDILSFQMAAEGAELSFASPELTGGTFYGMNTETLGADLAQMTGDDSVRSFGFNLFDLVDLAQDWVDAEAMEQSLKDAGKELWEAAEVEKAGKQTISVNGTETKTDAYRVTIPKAALRGFVDDLEDALAAMDYYGLQERLLRSMGMPEELLREQMDELKGLDVYGEMFDELRDAIRGDLELDVFLSGGYLSAVLCEGRVEDVDLELAVYLGGGKEYVDDLSVTFAASDGDEDVSVEITSTGDHGLKSGVYTDETTVLARFDGEQARVVSELSFNPGKNSDNFSWRLNVDSSGLSVCTLNAEGGLELGRELVSLDLNDVSVRFMGMKVCTLAFRYDADPHPSPISAGSAQMIGGMGEFELMLTALKLESNAQSWVEKTQTLPAARLPEELLYLIR